MGIANKKKKKYATVKQVQVQRFKTERRQYTWRIEKEKDKW